MIEIEQKFHLRDRDSFVRGLIDSGAVESPIERHADTYFNHPCRDFGETREALRIRRINDSPLVTYKGPTMKGKIKARVEMEWSLAPGDEDGTKWMDLLRTLGFREVRTVTKSRQPFRLPDCEVAVVVDQVEGLGDFAELELVIEDHSNVAKARASIHELANHLGLSDTDAEERSYLVQLLAKQV
ncbi:MAG: class IV adenylate cyclase [Planctomycetota bacterium]